MLKSKVVHLTTPATVVFLLLAACSGPIAPQPAIREVIVTRDNGTLPEGCSPAEAAQLIMDFLDTYNDGDQEKLVQFFPRTFEWYSDALVVNGVEVNQEHYFLTRPGSRDDLLNYVAERRRHGDRLQLLKVNVSGPGWHGGADTTFLLTREADDIQSGLGGRERYVHGSGTVLCRTQKFWTWSLTTRPPDFPESELFRVCPAPPPDSPEDAVIACTRW